MSVDPAGSSETGGCCKGVCTVAKLTDAIHGTPLGRRLIQSIAAVDGCAAAIASRADIGGRHLLDGAVVMIDHQRGDT